MCPVKARQTRPAFTLIELLVVIAIIATLMALLIPAVQKIRYAAARTQSINNLKQLALAAHSYHDACGYLPFNGATTNATNTINNSGSWGYQILPYVEQQPLFDSQNGTLPTSWNSALSVITCPLRSRPGYVNGTGAESGSGVVINPSEESSPESQYGLFASQGAVGWSYSFTFSNNSNDTAGGGYAMINNYTSSSNYAAGSSVSFSLAPGETLTTPKSTFNANSFMYDLSGYYNPLPGATGVFMIMQYTYILPNNVSYAFTVYPSGSGSGPVTDYGINPYINDPSGTINAANAYRRLVTISDGTSNTILAGHIYYALSDYPLTTPSATLMPIFAPGTLGTSRGSLGNTAVTWLQDGAAATSTQWGSPMAEGGLMAMCDGSVHMFTCSVALANFLTPDDGNPVSLP